MAAKAAIAVLTILIELVILSEAKGPLYFGSRHNRSVPHTRIKYARSTPNRSHPLTHHLNWN
jgi:hypothetical protein